MATDTIAAPATAPRLSTRAKLILFVLCAAQFAVALDFSILNVALPVLGEDLGLGQADLQWGVTAFALPSGGFLLLFAGSPTCTGGAGSSWPVWPPSPSPRCWRPSPGTRPPSWPGGHSRAWARR